jgi:hypothetical protein
MQRGDGIRAIRTNKTGRKSLIDTLLRLRLSTEGDGVWVSSGSVGVSALQQSAKYAVLYRTVQCTSLRAALIDFYNFKCQDLSGVQCSTLRYSTVQYSTVQVESV